MYLAEGKGVAMPCLSGELLKVHGSEMATTPCIIL